MNKKFKHLDKHGGGQRQGDREGQYISNKHHLSAKGWKQTSQLVASKSFIRPPVSAYLKWIVPCGRPTVGLSSLLYQEALLTSN